MRTTSLVVMLAALLSTGPGCAVSSQQDSTAGSGEGGAAGDAAGDAPSDGGNGGHTADTTVTIGDDLGSGAGAGDSGGEAGASSSTPAGAAAESGVPCGEETCSGATPVCCWDLKTHTGACIADGGDCLAYRLACDSRSDCGSGDSCCADGYTTECREDCEDGEMAFCADVSDCPPLPGLDVTCQPINPESLPFSTGYCAYVPPA